MPAGGLIKDSWATYAVAKASRGAKKMSRKRDIEYVEKNPPLLEVLRQSWKAGQEEARLAYIEKLVENNQAKPKP